MSARYVVFTGSVAAGASTAAKIALRRWRAAPLLEGQIEENNPFFKDAQQIPERWAFASQAHFLAASADRHRHLADLLKETDEDFVIEDRTPFEHQGAYSRAGMALSHLSTREYELLGELAREIEQGYLVPEVLVYREMTEEQLVERVRLRARDGESDDPVRLHAIHDAFTTFIAEWDKSPVVRVTADTDLLTQSGEDTLITDLSEHLGPPSR